MILCGAERRTITELLNMFPDKPTLPCVFRSSTLSFELTDIAIDALVLVALITLVIVFRDYATALAALVVAPFLIFDARRRLSTVRAGFEVTLSDDGIRVERKGSPFLTARWGDVTVRAMTFVPGRGKDVLHFNGCFVMAPNGVIVDLNYGFDHPYILWSKALRALIAHGRIVLR